MPKRTTEKAAPADHKEEVKEPKARKVQNKNTSPKAPLSKPKKVKTRAPRTVKAPKAETSKNENRPGLRSLYSNSRLTLLPLGFAADFQTGKPVVIFSDLATGAVHTIALSVWNRWKLKEVKKVNTET